MVGASGFVGRHVVSALAAAGRSVAAVVRDVARAGVVTARGAEGVVVRSLEAEALAGAFSGASAVVHLAHIGSERDRATYAGVNVGGTRAVVEAARRAGVRRLVLFSGLGVSRYGLAPRCTNRYFASKLAAEALVWNGVAEAVVFRPSYILGPGDGLLRWLLRSVESGVVERPGDGRYRLQPLAVQDAAHAVLAALGRPLDGLRRPPHLAVDLVGPEPLAFDAFVLRVAATLGTPWRPALHSVPTEQADAEARAGAWQGMPADELDCLLCDETADPHPLQALLGRPLTPLDRALHEAVSSVAGG